MAQVRFLRAVQWAGHHRAVGDVLDVPDKEAFLLCDAYKDAVRVDGRQHHVSASGYIGDVLEVRDPVADHRDPDLQSAKRKGK